MEAAHLVLGSLPGLGQLIRTRVQPGRAGEDAHGLGITRHQVRAGEACELQPVLEQPQEPVVPRQFRRFDASDVALCCESHQRRQGCALAHLRVLQPVHELQQLDGELDIPQAARAQLQLDVPLVRRDVLGDAFPHPLHRLHKIHS